MDRKCESIADSETIVTISKDKALLQTDRVIELLRQSYWANNRPKEIIEKSIENSLCYSAFANGVQVGFARVISDYATVFYICDVIVDHAWQGKGIGKQLIRTITEDELFRPLLGILLTRYAHGLYEQFGFEKSGPYFMLKPRE